jgi:MFS family permease
MQLAVSLFGPTMLLFALAPTELAGPTFAAMVFANGFGIAIHNVNQVTVRQVLTPDPLRARVMGVIRLAGYGALPLGTLAGGLIGELVGLRAALVVSGLGLLLGSIPYVLVRVVRLRTVAALTALGPSDEPAPVAAQTG